MDLPHPAGTSPGGMAGSQSLGYRSFEAKILTVFSCLVMLREQRLAVYLLEIPSLLYPTFRIKR